MALYALSEYMGEDRVNGALASLLRNKAGEQATTLDLYRELHLRRHRIRSGEQTLTITVPGEPVLAGIDPHHILWVEDGDDDNIEPVRISIEQSSAASNGGRP